MSISVQRKRRRTRRGTCLCRRAGHGWERRARATGSMIGGGEALATTDQGGLMLLLVPCTFLSLRHPSFKLVLSLNPSQVKRNSKRKRGQIKRGWLMSLLAGRQVRGCHLLG
ncbi:hypothetical protein BRADI_4g04073v3 [Brachypodium distachyon]|uniref:Uncharacterized protein n=1 Tax=Brachypodium distachyon TaxID=15368 RepID=A0A0Q3EIN1_BRADI|nr:hypothetical protein BRADI_4g04073v3 [Brachypodium distachyon]